MSKALTTQTSYVLAMLVFSLAVPPRAAADITGSVRLGGPPVERRLVNMAANPECRRLHPVPVADEAVVVDNKGNLRNVIVSIKPAQGQELGVGVDVPKEPVVLDQRGCVFVPHVVAIRVGQTLVVRNSDDLMHNVHSLAEENPAFNVAQPRKDREGLRLRDLTRPETFMVKCDIHPWMRAWVGVFEHPYFAVSDETGRYTINTTGLEDGDYTVQAWHETYGTTTRKVNIKGGKADADFEVRQPGAGDTPSPEAGQKK